MVSWISPFTPPFIIYLEHVPYFLLFNGDFDIFQFAISFQQLLYNLRHLERCLGSFLSLY